MNQLKYLFDLTKSIPNTPYVLDEKTSLLELTKNVVEHISKFFGLYNKITSLTQQNFLVRKIRMIQPNILLSFNKLQVFIKLKKTWLRNKLKCLKDKTSTVRISAIRD